MSLGQRYWGHPKIRYYLSISLQFTETNDQEMNLYLTDKNCIGVDNGTCPRSSLLAIGWALVSIIIVCSSFDWALLCWYKLSVCDEIKDRN